MAIHKRHIPGELAGRLKVERDPDGKLRFVPPPAERRDPVRPETTADERPPQAPDPRPDVPPTTGPA